MQPLLPGQEVIASGFIQTARSENKRIDVMNVPSIPSTYSSSVGETLKSDYCILACEVNMYCIGLFIT